MTNELTVARPSAIMPVMDVALAASRRKAIVEFTTALMVSGVDYGVIPGTGNKPTLLKPGAEKLSTLFGLSPTFPLVDKELDWTGDDHGGEPFFYFQYRCELRQGDILAGSGVGSCNSWEKKYRYRNAGRVCPECGKETIIKGRAEYGGGWLCYRKKGGCGAKWSDGDQAIEGQESGKVPNDNPADLVNTIDKMAQKRALIAATLIAVNASEFFTQDIEDMNFGDIVDAEWEPVTTPATNGNKQPTRTVTDINGELFGDSGQPDLRGAASPQAQAKRGQQRPKSDAGNVDWRQRALTATKATPFASAAAYALDGYGNEHHVLAALEQHPDWDADNFDPTAAADWLEWLEGRKENDNE